METVREIRNSIQKRGRAPSVREIMKSLGYKSPRSAAKIIDSLIKKSVLGRKFDGSLRILQSMVDDPAHATTIDIPLVGNVACGMPILAEENMEAMIPVSTELARPPKRYFFLRARGNSMDQKGIKEGDLVLVREQQDADNGDTIVALIDSEATIKEICKTDCAVILKPKSSDPVHQPIILTKNFQVQGKVIATIPRGASHYW